ncbi:MAG: extracellular solute-binding protein, partial [Oscillospiraceae bacterium]
TAQAYYEWTDSLTPVPYDGHAFFGRDAMANYFIIGSKQLGAEIFSVENGKATLNFEREIAKKLWDHYYTPFVHGYFSASGRFRSDDIKTGHLISFVGSSSGATFFPKEVILSDSQRYPIDMLALPCPQFEGGEKVAVQQGAGMVVTKTDEQQILASVEFLKWFTQDERNIQFSVSSGYLPVTKAANDIDKIHADLSDSKRIAPILSVSIDTVKNNTLYTTRAFANGTKARAILEHSLSDQAAADRQTVLTELAVGKTLAQATAAFDSEENFDAWYQDITERLKLLMK